MKSLSQGMVRLFMQWGGATYEHRRLYAGVEAAPAIVEDVRIDEHEIEPRYMPDPYRTQRYVMDGVSSKPVRGHTALLRMANGTGSIPQMFMREGCLTLYEVAGDCADLSDFNHGWTAYVMIYSMARRRKAEHGNAMAFDSDNRVVNSFPLLVQDVYMVGALKYDVDADVSFVDGPVIDAVYGGGVGCESCDGAVADRLYLLVQKFEDSPKVVYTVDGGKTWHSEQIVSDDESLVYAIEIVGRDLVVAVTSVVFSGVADMVYMVLYVNDDGMIVDRAVSGFDGVDVQSVRDAAAWGGMVFCCGSLGTIGRFSMDRGGVGEAEVVADFEYVNPFVRIAARDGVVMAVGHEGGCAISDDGGDSWRLLALGDSLLTAAEVVSRKVLWVGDEDGKVWVSVDGGETWENTLTYDGTIHDIYFVTDEVGYMATAMDGGGARFLVTLDGGYSWTRRGPRMTAFAAMGRINRVAAPMGVGSTAAVNQVAVVGENVALDDGMVQIGKAVVW